MKETKENKALNVFDVEEDALSDEADAAMNWIPVAMRLALDNSEQER